MKRSLPDDVRKDFPILQRRINDRPLVYLDNAATTQKPYQIIDTIKRFYEYSNSNVHRSSHSIGQEATDLYVSAHQNAARFIGAKSADEIVFVRSSTEAINLVAFSLMCSHDSQLGFKPGDEIVITSMEHHSNIVPWQMVRDQLGVTLKWVDIGDDGFLNMTELKDNVTERTKLVSCTHVSNLLGTVNPVCDIGRIAHDAGALFLVDGAQSVPHVQIDVDEIDCDFFVYSGHKMLAPMGIGVLYGKKDLLKKMSPFQYGGDMIADVTRDASEWNDLPWKFEAGTQNVAGGIALGGAEDMRRGIRLNGAIDYLNRIGMEAIRTHEVALTDRLLRGLAALPEVIVYGSLEAEKRQGIVAFNVEHKGLTADGHIIAQLLDEYGIAVRAGGHCAYPLVRRLGLQGVVRVSFYIYNTKDEVDYLLDSLKQIIRSQLL